VQTVYVVQNQNTGSPGKLIPGIDVEFPMIPLFLGLWAIVAGCVIVGYRSQSAIIANYIFWIVFVNFTPMQRD
jgi:hypothetical protein